MSLNIKIKEENNALNKFEMRAPPRRRVKGEELEEQPVFLRKAYAMISSCPSDIGGWSDKGDTVIIKDVKQFSEKIIPTSYKHNNFSSFVRQLNFYGFRKIKSESLENPAWWEFRHPSFLRGQPHLLSEIKRSVHFAPESASSKEVTDLKEQVLNLNERIANLNDQVEYLSETVTKLQISSPESLIVNNADSGKKRKVSIKKNPTEILLQRMSSTDSSYIVEEFRNEEVPSGTDFAKLNWLSNDNDNTIDMTEESEEFLDSNMFEDLLECVSTPKERGTTSTVEASSSSANTPSTPLPLANPVVASSTDFSGIMESLSPELKLRFIDKLAEAMAAQLASSVNGPMAIAQVEQHSDKENVLNQKDHASSSCQSITNPTFMLPSGSQAPDIALPLASAALGAFFMSSMQSLKAASSAATVPVKESMTAKV